jgi:tetratricopeptide (TPR) repeat protein
VEEKPKDWWQKQDRISLLISLFVFLFSLVVYLKTMAPTVSFWDCGEFIACAYILGVPHPPGTPLFVLISRLFTLLPIAGQIAVRVNFISALTSALTCWLTYLTIVKLLSRWLKENESLWLRLARYAGGIAGGLFLAFSMTFWSNAVEAEVYGISMLLMMIIFYLTLIWMERYTTPKGDKLLILLAYLGLLSTGIHMTVFIIMPAVFLLVILVDRRRLLDWRFWVTGFVFVLVMHRVTPFFIALGTWFTLTLLFSLFSRQKKTWAFFLLLTSAGVLGYSTQLYIPIRSYQEPAIDENNPSDWPSFKAFLERSQYGSESMLGRMFYRRGTLANQFGAKERMGFWGFFREQYMNKGLWIIPLFLGLLGVWEQIKRRKNEGVVLLFLLLACTVGLVLYMNFADGTRPDPATGEIIHIEVRDRDYFWTPGFMIFALLMGLGSFAVVMHLGRYLEKKGKFASPGSRIGQLILGVVVAVLLILPLLALKKNYRRNDRTGNWIPYDYAYNHLESCDQDGILITNGDNDTFPLWFLENVEKIRQDVRVINLSLLNADWYILQLKDVWKVPMDLTYDQIKGVPTRMGNRIVPRPAKTYLDPIRKTNHYLFPFYDEKAKKVVRIQDMMEENIVLTNNFKYPFYFARTTPPSSRVGLDDHCEKQGLVDLVVPQEGKDLIDPVRFRQNMFEVYRYRGLADINVYKDDNTVGLLMNYAERFIDLAEYYQQNKDTAQARVTLEKAVSVYPDYYRTQMQLYRLYNDAGEKEKADRLLTAYEARMDTLIRRCPEILLYYQYLGLAYQAHGKIDAAEKIMEQAYQTNSSDVMTYQILRQLYAYNKEGEKLLKLLDDWVKANPDDEQSRKILESYRSQK